MLTWIEGHLMVLGLFAIFSGFGLGAVWGWARRPAGRAVPAPRRSESTAVGRGAGAPGVRPRYPAR
jgi:hypothetical protein